MEPAAMLVRPLEIERGRPFEFGPRFQDKRVGRARIEPYFDDVGDLLPFGGGVGVAEALGIVGTNSTASTSSRASITRQPDFDGVFSEVHFPRFVAHHVE